MDVLDLLAVVEALPAHDLMRDACAGEVAFDGSRLGVHAVEDGMVCQMAARFQVLKVKPAAGDQIVEINFEKVGIKKTMANFAPLTKITEEE